MSSQGERGATGARGATGPPGPARYLTAQKAAAFFVVAVLVLAALAALIARNASNSARSEALTFASAEAAQNQHDSIKRSVDTCNRGNPARAYFQLRAEEFPKSVVTGHSYTTEIAADVFAILDCERTVANRGRPVHLVPPVAAEYLRWFRLMRVPTVVHGRIVGTTPFPTYFDPHP